MFWQPRATCFQHCEPNIKDCLSAISRRKWRGKTLIGQVDHINVPEQITKGNWGALIGQV